MSLFTVTVNADVKVAVHLVDGKAVEEIQAVRQDVAHIKTQLSELGVIMAQKFKNVDDAIEAVNTATSSLADRLAVIMQEFTDAGTDAERTAAIGKLNEIRTALDAMGADPNNPIPTPVV